MGCHIAMLTPPRLWTRIPRSRLRLPAGTETSIIPPCSFPNPQRAAALPWLSTAPGPEASTAAIQRPRLPSPGRPTA